MQFQESAYDYADRHEYYQELLTIPFNYGEIVFCNEKHSDARSGKVYDRSEGKMVKQIKLERKYPWALVAAWSKLLRKVVLDKKKLVGTKQTGGWCQIQKRTLTD